MSTGPEVVAVARREFESAWATGGSPPHPGEFVKRYRDQPESVRRKIAEAIVRIDLTERWSRWRQHNERVAAGTSLPPAPVLSNYVTLCPELGELNSIPAELIEFEFRTRSGVGDQVCLEDYCRMYPHATKVLEGTVSLEPAAEGLDTTSSGHDDRTIMEDPASPTASIRPGELPRKFNNYEIIKELGRGAMGVVYLARHTVLETDVAIKSILSNRFTGKREIDLFLNEARIAADLRHENIVRVLEAGEFQGTYFIAMEFVAGVGLDERIRDTPLDSELAARLTRQVAVAMHFAHTRRQPVYHRDIKPANILIDDSNTPYICDFGIAKRVETQSTSQDSVVGTPSYMPPEQATGGRIDGRSDVYSVGATLYTLLVGRPPFAAGNIMETLKQVIELDPVAPSELNPTVSRELEAICLKCLEKNPEQRYQTAQLLADDLDNLLNDRPIVARPPSLIVRFGKWKRRSPAMARMVLLVFTLLTATAVAGVGGSFMFRSLQIKALEAEREAESQRDKALVAQNEASEERDKAIAAAEGERRAKDKAIKAELEVAAERDNALMSEGKAKRERDRAFEAEREAKQQREKALAAQRTANRLKGEAEEQRRVAEANFELAEKQRTIAEQSQSVSQEAIDELLSGLADNALDDIPGMQSFRLQVIEKAKTKLQELAAIGSEELSPEMKLQTTEARMRLAVAYQIGGRLDDANREFEEALDAARAAMVTSKLSITQALRGRAEVTQDLRAEREILQEAATLSIELAREYSDDPTAAFNAGVVLNSYGVSLSKSGDPELAIEKFQESAEHYKFALQLGKTRDLNITLMSKWWRRLAESLNNRAEQVRLRATESDVEDAIRLYVTAFGIQLELLSGRIARPEQTGSQMNRQQFKSHIHEKLETYRQLSGRDKVQRSRVVRNDAAQTLVNMANSCLEMGRLKFDVSRSESMDWYRLALAVSKQAKEGYSQLATDFPSIPDYSLRQSGAELTQVAASYPDDSNELEGLIRTADRQIQLCRSLATEFTGRSADFQKLENDWIKLRSTLSDGKTP